MSGSLFCLLAHTQGCMCTHRSTQMTQCIFLLFHTNGGSNTARNVATRQQKTGKKRTASLHADL